MRTHFSKPIVQTPWFHGSSTGDFQIADLHEVLKKRNAVKPGFEQDRENPGSALITKQIVNISPSIVGNEAFNEVFARYFDELTFEFNKRVNIEELIDRIEDLDSDEIDVDYPADCSHCDIDIVDS